MRLTLLCAFLSLSMNVLGATCDEESTRWSPALEVASRILNASIEAERQARQDFETLLEQDRLSRREKEDYLFYLDDLERLVRTNTEAVERLRCMTVQTAPEPQPTETSGLFQTQEEVEGELDAQLSASLSQFDELLLRETEAARTSPRSTSWSAQNGGSSAGGQTGAPGSGQSGGQQSSEQASRQGASQTSTSTSGAAGSEPASTQTRDGASERVATTRGAAGISTGPTPADIPDGSDDDVVARQLREAAENETDPVLREKLWAEYRKYKNEQS